MNNRHLLAAIGASVALFSASASAADISLFDFGFNINGTVTGPLSGDPLPGNPPLDLSGFNQTTGLGTVSIKVSGTGDHFLGMFVDHEIDEAINTFFNEFGSPENTAGATQSWEIDEPGFSFGDITTNFSSSDNTVGSQLDNSNGVPDSAPDDVSMALGWDFNLTAGQSATALFVVSQSAPGSGFYLTHTDLDSDVSIYFSSALRIVGGGNGNNLPDASSTLPALAGALSALAAMRRFRRA